MVLEVRLGIEAALDKEIAAMQAFENAWRIGDAGGSDGQSRRHARQYPGAQKEVASKCVLAIENLTGEKGECGLIADMARQCGAAVGRAGKHQGQAGRPTATGLGQFLGSRQFEMRVEPRDFGDLVNAQLQLRPIDYGQRAGGEQTGKYRRRFAAANDKHIYSGRYLGQACLHRHKKRATRGSILDVVDDQR